MKVFMRFTLTFLAVFSIFAGIGIQVMAQPAYVDECLEQPELCEEPFVEEEETDDSELLQPEESGSLFFEIVRLVFALLLVLGLIYAFLYFLKRRNKFGNRINSLENVGGISVGQNKSVQLIRLGDRLYLIGVGESITLLEEIEDEALIEEIQKAREEQIADLNAGNLLSSFMNKQDKKGGGGEQFNDLFRRELKSLQKNRKSIIDKHKEDKHE